MLFTVKIKKKMVKNISSQMELSIFILRIKQVKLTLLVFKVELLILTRINN